MRWRHIPFVAILCAPIALAKEPGLERIRAAQEALWKAEELLDEAREQRHDNRNTRVVRAEELVTLRRKNLDEAYAAFDAEILAYATRPGWTDEARARIAKALSALDLDEAGSNRVAFAKDVIDGSDPLFTSRETVWRSVRSRANDPVLAALAAKADRLPAAAAGTQSETYGDCAVFALANVAREPYGVVAARTTKLLEEAEWRAPKDRAQPQALFGRGDGLTGAEVVLLAEAFGRVEAIPSTSFGPTLVDGHPILVSVRSDTGDDHQVVLSGVFDHQGDTFFVMRDSHTGPLERRYIRSTELEAILQENGVVFRRDENAPVVPLLREAP